MSDWRDDAACRGESPDVFHHPASVAYAKRICRGCPVRGDCLAHALAVPEGHGVWGGLTAEQRRSGPTVTDLERFRVLAEIDRGATSVAELMVRLGIDAVHARRHVGRLERDGLVVVSRRASQPLEIHARVAG